MTTTDLKIALRIILNRFGIAITDKTLFDKAVMLFEDAFSADEINSAVQQVRREWASCQN